jgi:hypothetical protein
MEIGGVHRFSGEYRSTSESASFQTVHDASLEAEQLFIFDGKLQNNRAVGLQLAEGAGSHTLLYKFGNATIEDTQIPKNGAIEVVLQGGSPSDTRLPYTVEDSLSTNGTILNMEETTSYKKTFQDDNINLRISNKVPIYE